MKAEYKYALSRPEATRNSRGGQTLEETPGEPPDGYFADGKPFWFAAYSGNSGRRYLSVIVAVTSCDGKEHDKVCALFRKVGGEPDTLCPTTDDPGLRAFLASIPQPTATDAVIAQRQW